MKLHKTILRLGSAPTGTNEGKRTWVPPTNSAAVNRDEADSAGLWQTSGPKTPIWLWQLIKQHVHTYSDWIEKLKLILDRILCSVCPRKRLFISIFPTIFVRKRLAGTFVDLFMRHGLELFKLSFIYFPLARLVLSWFKVMSHLSFHANLLDGSKQTLSAHRAILQRPLRVCKQHEMD